MGREYIHQSRGYRLGTGCCLVRIYRGDPGDAPVVLFEDLPLDQRFEAAENTGCLAAEIMEELMPDDLPRLPRPVLWIEHRPARRRGPGRYFLLTFSTRRPRPAGPGFVRRLTLGEPSREPLTPEEVAILTGEPDPGATAGS